MTSILLLMATILLSGCASTTEAEVATASAFEETTLLGPAPGSFGLDPKEIAIAVEEKLKSTAYMRQRVVVHGPKDELIEIESHMGRDRFWTEVYERDTLIMAYSLLDGRIQEFKPTLERRPFIEYDSPRPDGTDDAVFQHPHGCFTGAHLATWLSPSPNHRQSFFRRQIESATLIGMEEVGGRACMVLSHTWGTGDREFNHTFYIEPGSWLVVGWTSSIDGATRNRSYFDVHIADELPPDIVWSIRPLAVTDADRSDAE